MDCPECGHGKIRVVTQVVDDCSHHPVICDHCLAIFVVAYGLPATPIKLPPKYPITRHQGWEDVLYDFGNRFHESYRRADGSFHLPTLVCFAPFVEDYAAAIAPQYA